tara:strand:+ start:165 stop:1646 length:1482 start_codon:yes stop_codon:yes gene_type:complete
MKKLAVILPYDENHIENFTSHFDFHTKNQDDFEYKLIFMKQKSNRPLNKGKLFNIGYQLYKQTFDYFCFHDIDLIPISDECDYSYDDRPISLISMRKKIEFGDQEKVQNFNDYTLPYDEYFGGATLFSKENFEQVNGYSNEYWGIGYEDYDLLLRCVINELPIRKDTEIEPARTYGKFNGMNSYIEIPTKTKKIKNSTSKGFSMSAWINPNGEPPYGADVDNNRCEYFIFGRPGFHTGISYTHGGFVKAVIWTRESDKPDRVSNVIRHSVECNSWNHITLTVDDTSQQFFLYVNGVCVDTSTYKGELLPYHSKPFYIGVGDPNINFWRNFFNGQIAEVGLWSSALQEGEVHQVFSKGIIDSKGEYITSNIPVGIWDFKGGYSNITFDTSGGGNHANYTNVDFATKSLKSTNERYLPYRRNGAYGYVSHPREFENLENLSRTAHREVVANRKIFNKKIKTQMEDINKDGLSSTRFRIVNRSIYQEKHEVIEVVI